MKTSTKIWTVLLIGLAFLIGQHSEFRSQKPENDGRPMLGIQSARAAGFLRLTTDKLMLPKSGTAWYIRLISVTTHYIWDENAGAMSETTTWANSKMAMTDETQTKGGWTRTLSSGLPPDRYYVMPCDQAGATAVYTDWDEDNPMPVIWWHGGKIIEISSF